MSVDEQAAVMPQAVIDASMIEAMEAKVGARLRIDHSVNNEVASRIAVTKFAGGIGDINPLWTEPDYATGSPYGAPVAPPSFIIGCFSGIQFGWPGLGSFHSMSHLRFERPVYWNDWVHAECVYDGFDGPSPSTFAGRSVTDRFVNSYRNQHGERIATINWNVINFERGSALAKRGASGTAGASTDGANTGGAKASGPQLPHRWELDEVADIEARVLAERPRGKQPRYWEDVAEGDLVDPVTKGPIGLTDEIAFVAGGGTPIPRLKAHAAALHDYQAHPAWAFRDPITSAREPIYSVHYNLQAARAMSVPFQYDVGFQRQCWQIHHLTHWAGDHGWIKECRAEYRRFVYLSDVIELRGKITGKRVDDDGEHVVDIRTEAVNQRGETVMPGTAVVALPSRNDAGSPAGRRAR
ncbi:MAG TPA: MaoC family dehydratase N-terminal domain-containing protein [Pseudonocardia sp.]|jgi:acyl dehydratase|uniref:FAS1-like dehydratase domain-containing protein n=1 Tax=Pseudonocardia sp. TaxID=60912 RepID=UPI002ED8ABE3